MKNVTITDISAHDDVDFDQAIDTDTVIASGGGVAVNGNLSDSAVNTGYNSGILAGDDVHMDDSIVGDGNTQLNDSTVGAFSGRGNATNVTGENVNMGSGDLLDVDAEGDAQVAHGNGNRFMGDVDTNLHNVDGPINLAIGDENRQSAIEDNSTTYEDSYNTDNSMSDSYNERYEDSYNETYEDNDSTSTSVEDSFNQRYEDNDTSSWDWDSHNESTSTYEDNDSYKAELDYEEQHVDVWGDDNEVELEA
jgi:hypothetical protein